MKLRNFGKIVAASAFGAALLLAVGVSDASAQGNSRWAHEKNRIRKEQKQYEKDQKRAAKQYRFYRGGSYYQTDYRGAELLRRAVENGYRQGYQAGIRDRRYRRDGGYYGVPMYRTGTYGYQSYVDRSQYQYYFQQGFQRGYEDGFNSRTRYGVRSGSTANILGAILNGILNMRQY